MAYSCSDFTDDVLKTLDIVMPRDERDDPYRQAVLACDEIVRLKRCEAALRKMVNWGREHTGPRDANSPHDLLVEAARALRTRQ